MKTSYLACSANVSNFFSSKIFLIKILNWCDMTDSSNSDIIVRAFWRAVKVETAVPPYDTLHLKVFYPAQTSDSQLERDQGIVPNGQLFTSYN